MPDMDFWLGRKYALLQQQADANTAGAAATTKNAATNAFTGRAAALLDTTRANLLPKESQASIAKMGAETNLLGEQASIVAPESVARIAQMRADTAYTGTQDKVLQREGLMERTTLPASLAAVLGRTSAPTFSLGNITPARDPRLSGAGAAARSAAFDSASPLPLRRTGETQAQWLDRINGF